MPERLSHGGTKRVPRKSKRVRKAGGAAVANGKARSEQAARDEVVLGLAGIRKNPLGLELGKEEQKRVEERLSSKVRIDTSTAEGREAFRKEARRNFRFYCKNVAVIQPKYGSLSKLTWNKAQTRLALTLVGQLLDGKPMMAIVAKARQWGCSTLLTALVTWRMLTVDGYGVCLVIHEKKFLPEFREKYRLMLNAGCRVFGHRLVVDNSEQMRLSNGARVDFYAAGTKQSSEQIRSSTYNFAHLTEIPYWYDVHKTLGTVTSAIDLVRGNGICIESTPRSRGDAFHGLYQSAKAGKIGYAPVFVPWHELDGYSVALTEKEEEAVLRYLSGGMSTRDSRVCEVELGVVPDKDGRVARFGLSAQQYVWWCRTFRDKATLNINTMRTEYPDDDETCFLTSGRTVLTGDELKQIGDCVVSQRALWRRGIVTSDGVFAENAGGWFEMFEPPIDGAQYILSADIAQGAADGDFTCFGIGRRNGSTVQLVAAMYDRCDTSEAAERARLVCMLYGDPLVVPESNGPGVAFILDIRRLGVKNIWVRRKVNSVTGGVEDKLGIQTTASTKPAMIAALKKKVRNKELICGWAPAYVDLSAFCWSDASCTTAKAVKGAHDDAAMMLAIMCYAFEQTPDMGARPAEPAVQPDDFLTPKTAHPDYALFERKDGRVLPDSPAARPSAAPSFLDYL